jgi:hypothetical protein
MIMQAQDQKRDNAGILRKNARKERPSQPDYTGSLTVSGKDYWLSAWKKENERGAFLSLALQPKDERPKPAPKESAAVPFDDAIDF